VAVQISRTVTSDGEKGHLMNMLWGFLLPEVLWGVHFNSDNLKISLTCLLKIGLLTLRPSWNQVIQI